MSLTFNKVQLCCEPIVYVHDTELGTLWRMAQVSGIIKLFISKTYQVV